METYLGNHVFLESAVVIYLFFYLLFGSYTDIKKREVPDWLNYSAVMAGFGLSLYGFFSTGNYVLILDSLAGFFLAFLIAVIMFYSGQWGGGDSKMLMGLGAIMGLNIKWFSGFEGVPFFLDFLFILLFVGGVYGFLWLFSLFIANMGKVRRKLDKSRFRQVFVLMIVLLFVAVVLFFFSGKNAVLNSLFLLSVLFFSALFLYFVLNLVKVVESVCMIKKVKAGELSEGDWINKEVKVNGKVIAGPKDYGISKKQIKKLLKLEEEGKLKRVEVKEGIPFVPSFLFAYLIGAVFRFKGYSFAGFLFNVLVKLIF